MVYRFHDYTLDPASREVRHGAHRLALEPKVFQVLLYLLEHRDRMVSKAELLEQCWPETFVSESALTRCLARLRKAVQPTPTAPPVIETRHRQGYRFVAEVTVLAHAPPSASGDTALLHATVPAAPTMFPDAPVPSAPVHSALLPVPAARSAALGAARRQLTVLFCDMVDSATLAGQLDPEDLRTVTGGYHAACTAVIQRYGGHVAQSLGEGLLVYFGWPQAHEDDARRAVHAGLALVTAVRDHSSALVQDWGLRLAVRIGIHTGLVVVGAEEWGAPYGQFAVGATLQLAAQIQSLATPDTVVISAATYALVQGYFICDSMGEHHLPGTTAPSDLFQVRGTSGARGRLDLTTPSQRTPFVGREVERAVLRERAAQVRQGLGQVVLLSGDAGIGKSRLVQEVTATLAADDFTCLDCRCSPYSQHTALHPVIAWLQRGIQDDTETSVAERLARLEDFLRQARLDLPENLPLVAALLSLPLPEARYPALQLTPQRQRQRTLETLVALLVALAERQPVLLVVEDLHWSDPTTLEWLGLVMDQGPTAPIFTLLTCRPTFTSPWGGRTHVTLLPVPRLAAPQVTQMVQWLDEGQLSTAQQQHIVTQADGVPLFIEEVTKFVLAAQRLQGQTGRHASDSTVPEIAIPATLQDSLMARLDQLGPAKSTAQLGATIGREFPAALLRAVTPLDEDLVRQDLKQLVDAELLYQRGVGATAVYQFKHALIQDAAYQSLLKSTRQQYHQRIAQVLAERFPETAATQPALVAQHYTAAGLHAQALPYWQRAGQHALERSAHREAVASLEQGLEAVAHLLPTPALLAQAVDLRLTLRNALFPLGELPQMVAHLHHAETLAASLDDHERLGRVYRFLGNYCTLTGDYDGARTYGERALALATLLGNGPLQQATHIQLGRIAYEQGEYPHAIDILSGCVASLGGTPLDASFGLAAPVAVMSRVWLIWSLAELGAFDEGRRHSAEATRIATALNHPFSRVVALLSAGLLALRQGEIPQAIAPLEQSLTLCQATPIRNHLPAVAAALGSAYAHVGRVAEALPLLEQADAQLRAMTRIVDQAFCHLCQGEVALLAGRIDEAHHLAERTVAQCRTRQERGALAYALRLLGDITARRELPDIAPAEAHYQHALALAEALGMRPLQAHCHYGLGTLYRQTGRAALARAALSTAIEMYRAMDMTFWLPQAEAALAQGQGP